MRVAEGLDRSHSQVVADLKVSDDGDGLVVRVDVTGDAELEQWAAERYLPPLETELECPVRVDVQTTSPRRFRKSARAR